MNKKIMILGGGTNQYPFVMAAHKIGLVVVLCDMDPNNMSIDYADIFYEVSIIEKNKLLEIAINESIDGIFTSSEPGMYSVSYIAEKLSLPSIPYQSFLTLVNKSKMKKFLENNDFNYPRYIQINQDYNLEELVSDLDGWKSKIIVKPIDSSGSRGVNLVDDLDKLNHFLDEAFSYSKSKNVIIEEYIEQKYDFMIGGDIFVMNKDVVFWGIMDSMRNLEVNDIVPTGTSFPTSITDMELRQVKQAIKKVIKLLGINFGPLNIEIMYDKSGKLYINELNPRSGGNKIPEILMKATGFDYYVNVCLGACGLDEIKYEKDKIKYLSTYVIHSKRTGIFSDIFISDEISDNIIELTIDKQTGDKVKKFSNAHEKIGIMFLEFENSTEMKVKLKNINEYIKVNLQR